MPLHVAFVDLTKAFDYVNREALFTILKKVGCPPALLDLIKSFHENMQGTAQVDVMISEPFPIVDGVKQGCVLAPTLFGIYFSVILREVKQNGNLANPGVGLRTRFDANLFSMSHLKAKTKTTTLHVCEALYIDDAAFCSFRGTAAVYHRHACSVFGLKISVKKTVIRTQVAKITLSDEALETVENFLYLGSVMSNNFTLDKELNTRLNKAATSFGRFSKRVWSNKSLTLHTKLKVYHVCVLSIILYGAETWTTYRKQELKLNSFHLRCLHTILGVKWQDKITNLEILQRCNTAPLSSILRQRWLLWLGHIHRVPIDSLPKQIMYGELTGGKRPVG